MKVPGSWQCELCGREFDTPYAVRDEVIFMNGENDRAYPYVCAKDLKALVELLDREFPKNKYVLRIKEAERIAASVAH